MTGQMVMMVLLVLSGPTGALIGVWQHRPRAVEEWEAQEFGSRMECPHDSSSGGYGPDRTWRCDECGEITGREPVRLPARLDTEHGIAGLLRHHGVPVEFTDDEETDR